MPRLVTCQYKLDGSGVILNYLNLGLCHSEIVRELNLMATVL